MKKAINTFAVATILVCTSLFSFGTEPSPTTVSIKAIGAKSFVLRIQHLKETDTKVLLKDTEGYILHSRNIKNEKSYNVKYNLKNLPNGKYMIELTNTIYGISIIDGKIAINSEFNSNADLARN